MFQAYSEDFYPGSKDALVALTVPHGADARTFLEFFSEIGAHPEMQACWPLFETYLSIERDIGSSELAHSLAAFLSSRHGLPTLVLTCLYPRGIIDGGRLKAHCLRSCLPTALFLALKARFEALHDETLRAMPALYKRLRSAQAYALVDVHTMASYCPADAKGQRSTLPVSFPRLEDYVEQFLGAREHDYKRCVDLITEDESGRSLADPQLLSHLREELEAKGFPVAENDPYRVSSAFLSHQHLSEVPGISIDVPKHLLADWREDLTDYELNAVTLDLRKIEALALCLSDGIAAALNARLCL